MRVITNSAKIAISIAVMVSMLFISSYNIAPIRAGCPCPCECGLQDCPGGSSCPLNQFRIQIGPGAPWPPWPRRCPGGSRGCWWDWVRCIHLRCSCGGGPCGAFIRCGCRMAFCRCSWYCDYTSPGCGIVPRNCNCGCGLTTSQCGRQCGSTPRAGCPEYKPCFCGCGDLVRDCGARRQCGSTAQRGCRDYKEPCNCGCGLTTEQCGRQCGSTPKTGCSIEQCRCGCGLVRDCGRQCGSTPQPGCRNELCKCGCGLRAVDCGGGQCGSIPKARCPNERCYCGCGLLKLCGRLDQCGSTPQPGCRNRIDIIPYVIIGMIAAGIAIALVIFLTRRRPPAPRYVPPAPTYMPPAYGPAPPQVLPPTARPTVTGLGRGTICFGCGATVPAGATSCPRCGKPV